ncbi:MAG: hypothetical protein JXQ29_16925 [Planctomycetes bacterium]|nr:hypothetical protein [Planctomycetota bacterium]
MGSKNDGRGTRHTWQFFRAGGFDQVRLDAGADLVALEELDQKLWVALACPTRGVEFDTKTLDLIDTDHDGRIRAPEILAATKWAAGRLKNPDQLLKGSPSLPLAAIDTSKPEGKTLLASAQEILRNLGKKEAAAISIEDTTDTTRIFAQTKFNGDGVVPLDASDEEETAAVLRDIVSCLGSVTDRSGKPGVDQERVDRFFAEAAAFQSWRAKAEADADGILPLGPDSQAAHAALVAVRPKVEDFFTRCRLAAFAPASLPALNPMEKDYAAVASQELSLTTEALVALPLATVAAGARLPLGTGINPTWAGRMAAFRDAVAKPLLGDCPEITVEDWDALTARFTGFEAWTDAKAGAAVEGLGIDRVREILASEEKARIDTLIRRDKALEPEATAIAAVDKLVRLHRDLYKLLNNFVAFREFYGRRDKAIFQVGTLYLDQRSCDLCIRVDDVAKHAVLAGLGKTCLVYCDCTRPGSAEKMTIAAAFTDGDSDNLMVGRNGLFYDRKGQDWDATITKIISNPISIREAFLSPYKRFVRMIEETVAKRAAAAEAESTKKMESAASAVGTADKPKPAEPKKIDVGVVAALGVAVGAISMAVGSLVTGVLQLAAWQMPLVLVAIILVISGPSMIIAWLKLRQRNLGPILDANGWAVNSMAKLNIPFGRSLTGIATLPPGSKRDRRDPYAPRKSTFRKIVEILVLVAVLAGIAYGLWYYGIVEKVLPERLPKSQYVLDREAPEPAPAVPESAPAPGEAK